MADPLEFSDLYGTTGGVGSIVGETSTASVARRKDATNDAYIELAAIKGYWRKRETTLTKSTTPALTDGVRIYNLPSDFDEIYKAYYSQSGVPQPIIIIKDAEFLQRLRTGTTDKGYPSYARIVQSSLTQRRIEFQRAISQVFIDQIATITIEYFIQITRMVADTDAPMLPGNLRHHIKYLGANLYAIGQGDQVLINNTAVLAARARFGIRPYPEFGSNPVPVI